MAKSAGRNMLVKVAGATIAGVRTTGLSFNGTPIDDSDQLDGAEISYLSNVFGESTMEITVGGVQDGEVLRDKALSISDADKFFSDLTFVFANADVVGGDWILVDYSEGGEFRDAGTFDAKFQRNGVHTIA